MTFKTSVVLTAFGVLAGCSRGEDAHELASINRAALSPPNDRCANAQTLPLNTPVSGTLVDANDDLSCGGTWGPDVFYRFTPSSSGTFRASVTTPGGGGDAGSAFMPFVSLTDPVCLAIDGGWGGWCRSAGAPHYNFRATAATPEVLVVDSWSAVGAGVFTVEVRPLVAASNDTCAAPLPLSLGAPLTVSFDDALDDDFTVVDGGFACSDAPDLVYSFTAPTTGRYRFSSSTGVMSVTTGTCAMTCASPTMSRLIDLSVGTTAFLVLEGFAQTTLRVDPVTPPANDLCSNAQPIPAGTATMGTTVASSGEVCSSQGDVYFRFTSTDGGTYRATLDNDGGLNVVTLGPDSCVGAISCYGIPTATFRLGAGQSSTLTVSTISLQSPFQLRVDPISPPPNDDCRTPTSISLGVPVPVSLDDAVDDMPGGPDAGAGSCGFLGSPDVHFRFVAPATGRYRFSGPFLMSVSQGSCGGACLAQAGFSTLDVSLSAGDVGVVTVEGFSNSGALVVEQLVIPSNDLCVNAQALTVGTSVSGTTLGAAPDLVCNDRPEVFYRFSAPSTGPYVVRLDGLDGGTALVGVTRGCGTDAGSSLFDGGRDCVVDYEFVRFNANAGQTHTVSVSHWVDTSFSIRVDALVPPSNDSCAAPMVLTPGVSVPVDLLAASDDVLTQPNDAGFDAGASCGSTGVPDLVYRLTAPASGRYDFEGPGDLSVSVGSCGTDCAIRRSSFASVVLQAGETAFVVLEGAPFASGAVTAHYAVQPSNDRCQAPRSISLGTWQYGTTRGATSSFACAFGANSPDVIYQFTPPTTGRYRALISNDAGWVAASWAEARCDGGCLSSDERYRGTSGVPAFLVVSSLQPPVGTEFGVSVEPISPPSNDTCASPVPVDLGVLATGSVLDAVDDYPQLGGCGGDGGCACGLAGLNDVVWSFTAPTEDDYVVMTNGSVGVGRTCGSCSTRVIGDVQVHLAAGETTYAITEPFAGATSLIRVERATTYFDGGVRLDAGWVGPTGGGASGVGGGASGSAGGAGGGPVGGGPVGGGAVGGGAVGGGAVGGGSVGGGGAGGAVGGGAAGGAVISGGSATAGGSVSGGGTGGGGTNEGGCSGCSSSGSAVAFALALLTLRRRLRA